MSETPLELAKYYLSTDDDKCCDMHPSYEDVRVLSREVLRLTEALEQTPTGDWDTTHMEW